MVYHSVGVRESSQAPRGSRLHELLVNAHTERFLFYHSFDDDRDSAWTYFQRHSVARDVLTAWDRRFVGRIGWQPWRDAQALNHFAFCFWQMYHFPKVREAFEAVGPYVNELPWRWVSRSAEEMFVRARRQAYGLEVD